MSKMSELYRELSEQAVEMGYSSLEYATDVAGCEIDYKKGRLLPPEEAAHNALLKEKKETIEKLIALRDAVADLSTGTDAHPDEWAQTAHNVDKAIEFIKQEVR